MAGSVSKFAEAEAEIEKRKEEQRRVRSGVMKTMGPAIFLIVGEGAALINSRPHLVSKLVNDKKGAAVVLNAMMASGAFAEFLLNPIVGRVSDRTGRKGLLVLLSAALAVSRLSVFVNPGSLRALRIDRIASMALVTSFFSLVRAAQHDVYDRESASLAAASVAKWAGLGVVLGPFIGELVSKYAGAKSSFLASAVMAASCSLLFATQLQETLEVRKQKPLDRAALVACNPLSFTEMMGVSGPVRTLMVVSLLQTFGDPRNVQEATALFMKEHLAWTRTQMNNMISVNGLSGIAGSMIAATQMKMLGVRGHTSFSNLCQALQTILFGLAPHGAPWDSFFLYLSLVVGVGGSRKRDGVESTATQLCVAHGIGKGQASAGLANWRSVASILAPVFFGSMYSSGFGTNQRKQFKIRLGGGRGFVVGEILPQFLVVAMLSILAEVAFRTLSERDLSAGDTTPITPAASVKKSGSLSRMNTM